MITAKEAQLKTMTYYNCQDKIAYYEEYVDKYIRESAEKGKSNLVLKINENIFTDTIVEHIGNLLIENGYTVQVGTRGYVSTLFISW